MLANAMELVEMIGRHTHTHTQQSGVVVSHGESVCRVMAEAFCFPPTFCCATHIVARLFLAFPLSPYRLSCHAHCGSGHVQRPHLLFLCRQYCKSAHGRVFAIGIVYTIEFAVIFFQGQCRGQHRLQSFLSCVAHDFPCPVWLCTWARDALFMGSVLHCNRTTFT